MSPAAGLADAVQQVARYALAFSRTDRTACQHPDGSGPESDADHTVMLGWIVFVVNIAVVLETNLCWPNFLWLDWQRDVGASIEDADRLLEEMVRDDDFRRGVSALLQRQPPEFD